MNWQEDLDNRIKEAAGNHETILGKPLGPAPKYFIIGDSPNIKDTMTGHPFSGNLMPVLASAIHTLHEAQGATDRDCYITYLVKAVVRPQSITKAELEDVWLPIAQQEYALSGCQLAVGVGKYARLYTGEYPMRPSFMPEIKPTFLDKIRDCYKILTR